MPVAEKIVFIEKSADLMFDLVDRIEDYPQFLPWCGKAEVVERHADGVTARLEIDFHGIRQHFTTRNHYDGKRLISMTLVDGPFHILDGAWRFKPLGEAACKIEFRLHYEFSNHLLARLVGPIFQRISSTFVDAFIQRAERDSA